MLNTIKKRFQFPTQRKKREENRVKLKNRLGNQNKVKINMLKIC